jgi:20S proteasome subunit beta 4
LRKGPYQANLLLAGWDKNHGASLYYIDYLASMHKVNKAAHGYASYFTLGAMDKYWRPNMSLNEAVDLLKKCVHELRTRFIIGQPSFIVKVVDANGIRTLDLADFA